MSRLNTFWQTLKQWPDAILSPSIDEKRLTHALQQARQSLPIPVFWLLGKTQSGKSSIIQALTGSTKAEIGQGFRACTRSSAVFDFPDSESAFIRFLDTRGLSEAGYDPSEDMAWCEQRAHLLIVVIKAMDPQQDAIVSAVHKIRQAHPEWPVLVLQTCLHEGYSKRDSNHPLPYPFAGEALDSRIPHELARSIQTQRKQFSGLNAQFVAIDFTLPEDGYDPVDSGLDEMWQAIENLLPLGLQTLLRQQETADSLNSIYQQHAHPHIVSYAISAGMLAAIPVPVVSLPLVIACQAKLFHSIASIYGLPLQRRSISEIASAIGIGGLSVGYGGRELAKLIPAWGSAIAGISTAAMTYSLGKTLCIYYDKTHQGQAFSPKTIRAVYDQEFERGKKLLRDRFNNKQKD